MGDVQRFIVNSSGHGWEQTSENSKFVFPEKEQAGLKAWNQVRKGEDLHDLSAANTVSMSGAPESEVR